MQSGKLTKPNERRYMEAPRRMTPFWNNCVQFCCWCILVFHSHTKPNFRNTQSWRAHTKFSLLHFTRQGENAHSRNKRVRGTETHACTQQRSFTALHRQFSITISVDLGSHNFFFLLFHFIDAYFVVVAVCCFCSCCRCCWLFFFSFPFQLLLTIDLVALLSISSKRRLLNRPPPHRMLFILSHTSSIFLALDVCIQLLIASHF